MTICMNSIPIRPAIYCCALACWLTSVVGAARSLNCLRNSIKRADTGLSRRYVNPSLGSQAESSCSVVPLVDQRRVVK